MVLKRVAARHDRQKAITSFRIRDRAARHAGEIQVERCGVVVDAVRVAARGVGLPDFHQRLRDRPPILVECAAVQDDPLADRFAGVLARQVGVGRADSGNAETPVLSARTGSAG